MGWWHTGENEDELIGDEPADAVTSMLAKLTSMRKAKTQPPPTLQQLLDCLAAALKSTESPRLHDFHGLKARLSDGDELESKANNSEDHHMIDAIKDGIIEIDEIYREAFERSPTLREIVDNFAFVLGYKPTRFLTGLEQAEVEDFRAE